MTGAEPSSVGPKGVRKNARLSTGYGRLTHSGSF
jgi:hypothetical protein